MKEWIIRFFQRLLGKPSPASRPSLEVALERYHQVLDGRQDDPLTLLPVLLARDQVEVSLKQTDALSTEQVQQLVTLDNQLRKETPSSTLEAASAWRKTLQPPDTHWWWFLDQAEEKRQVEKDLIWVLLTGTLMALTIPLALEIIKRLWVSAPDIVSIFGTLFTLLLTASPLTKRGRELAQWVFKRVPRLKPTIRAEAMGAMAFIAFVLVLIAWLLLPRLAVWYNNQGYEAADDGHLTLAQRSFQRAVSLDADLAVGYYHLGTVYEDIARPDEAIGWYQQAIEYDLDLGAAYNNLGRLYLLKGEPEQAVQVLQAGLKRTPGEAEVDQVTRYRLLSNVGWAYYVLGQSTQAREVLEQAIELENELDVAFKSAVPRYYLALTYETLEQPDAALEQWEDSLRYLDAEDPVQIGWNETIYEHLERLREEVQ